MNLRFHHKEIINIKKSSTYRKASILNTCQSAEELYLQIKGISEEKMSRNGQ